jgi:hypothetical protein
MEVGSHVCTTLAGASELTKLVEGYARSIEIDWARFLGFEELTEFLGDIALHVTRSDSDVRRNAQQNIQSALTRTLWDNYRISRLDDPDFEQWGELTVSFHGTALPAECS